MYLVLMLIEFKGLRVDPGDTGEYALRNICEFLFVHLHVPKTGKIYKYQICANWFRKLCNDIPTPRGSGWGVRFGPPAKT